MCLERGLAVGRAAEILDQSWFGGRGREEEGSIRPFGAGANDKSVRVGRRKICNLGASVVAICARYVQKSLLKELKDLAGVRSTGSGWVGGCEEGMWRF